MLYGDIKVAKPICWGMVGGGKSSQIGYSHRSAALRDNSFRLQAGAFDIDPERGKEFGLTLLVDGDRCYPDYQTMFAEEAKRADGIEAVTVATPNNTHYAITKAALEAGLHVICEKPLCFTVTEAAELRDLAKAKNKLICVTYGYAGHQMIQQARAMIGNGDLGEIRIVQMSFAHGFHSEAVEANNPAAKWRMNPEFAGPSYVLGDLGTHPLYISEVMLPELKIKKLLCSRQSFVKSRAPLEDNAFVMMEYDTGAMASMWISAVNAGSMHNQRIRVVGSPVSNGGTNILISCPTKSRADRHKPSNVVWTISILKR